MFVDVIVADYVIFFKYFDERFTNTTFYSYKIYDYQILNNL